MYTKGKSSGSVNDLLHRLRGEQFRQKQNIRGSTTHLQTSSLVRNSPSLPFSLLDLIDRDEGLGIGDGSTPSSSFEHGTKLPAGPVPKSWIPTKNQTSHVDRNSRSWRIKALSLVFLEPTPSVPPLTEFCLRVLLRIFSDPAEFANELSPTLPHRLRCDLMHYTAINNPLSNQKLYSLFGPVGHADGEIILIGPQASLWNEILPLYRFNNGNHTQRVPEEISPLTKIQSREDVWEDESWDADSNFEHDDWAPNTHLRTLVVISASFSMQTYLNFPPTLIRLALIDLPMSVPIHRLPGLCPLLIILDLSFNSWLDPTNSKNAGETVLGRVDWQRWGYLQTLGLRECNVGEGVLKRVNHRRLVDIDIIQ